VDLVNVYNMNTISIGDIHGHDSWKVIDPNKYDKIIFVGDYVDSFDISDDKILNNLLDIIQFKKSYSEKVILLFGNHDIQYLFNYSKYGCSGFRPQMYEKLHNVFNQNKSLFSVAYQIENTLWTHAGVHQGWYKQRYKQDISSGSLNVSFINGDQALFDVGYRRGGYYDVGGIFWCDKTELIGSPYRNLHQIVGHTHIDHITKIYKHNKEIVFIDVLNNDKCKFYEKTF
jgi:hypothetical protein